MPSSHDDTAPHAAWESEGGAVAPSRSPRPGTPGYTPSLATGYITALFARGDGLIASDTHKRPWHLPFRRADVTADQFDRLQVGDRVRFLQEASPERRDRQHAILVEVWPVPTHTTPPPGA